MTKLYCASLALFIATALVGCRSATEAVSVSPIPVTTTPIPQDTAVITSAEERASVVKVGDVQPPTITTPCEPSECLFVGQKVTIIVNGLDRQMPENSALRPGPIVGPLYEVKAEFEAATGATLEIIESPLDEHFTVFITDLTTGAGRYDASIAGAWWLGDLVSQGFIQSYDAYLDDPRFPKWDIDDVQSAPRTLLQYEGQNYMVANDHDGQVLYYRRDLFEDPQHQDAFAASFGYALDVPQTWSQFRDIASYFDGLDLNGDDVPDDGLTLHLKAGQQGMFHFMSFSAPYVIGPENPTLYWFDPDTMLPLIDSPGHVRALEAMVELVQFGPEEMLTWDLGQSWDHFLRGEAAITFTWGDLGALAQQEGSQVKGKIGTAQLPGTMEYYDLTTQRWVATEAPNQVGNTTGGSWAGVISRFSDNPEATYYLLAMLASREKSLVYAARGWDGVDPGRFSHYLPPNGNAELESYLSAGWDATDIQQYSDAYYTTFNNQLQFPYLRIPGTFGYWSALDIHLFEALTEQISPAQALSETVIDFKELTNLLGRDQQIDVYRISLGLEETPSPN